VEEHTDCRLCGAAARLPGRQRVDETYKQLLPCAGIWTEEEQKAGGLSETRGRIESGRRVLASGEVSPSPLWTFRQSDSEEGNQQRKELCSRKSRE
jgi:hypothetical protein